LFIVIETLLNNKCNRY